jgi:phospholipase C
MKNKFERTYGRTIRGVFHMVNPVKKRIMKTNCIVHKYINYKAIDILSLDGYEAESAFLKKYIVSINDGVKWADQDFKSTNHFYSVGKGRGLYGFSNALTECSKYYNSSVNYYYAGDIEKSMFYLGAACHLIQDSTVPQHVNNKLLKEHRKFEMWIIGKYMSDDLFIAKSGLIKYNSLEEFIRKNAEMATKTYFNYINIIKHEDRYNKIATTILKEAQRTTAGFMLFFFDNIELNKKSS